MKQLIAKSLIAGSLLLGLGVIACEDARRRDNNELNTTTGTNDYDEGSGAATSSRPPEIPPSPSKASTVSMIIRFMGSPP